MGKIEKPSFKEDLISQMYALSLLQKLGYQYLTTEKADSIKRNKI